MPQKILFSKIFLFFLLVQTGFKYSFGQNVINIDSLQYQLSVQKNDSVKLDILFELFRHYYYLQSDSAIYFANKGLELSMQSKRKSDNAIFLNACGQYYIQKEDYTSALKHHLNALRLRETLNNKKDIASSLNNIGLVYQNIGNNRNALNFFSKSLKINQEINDKPGIAHNLNNISIIYAKERKYDAAILYGQNALDIWKELNELSFVAAALNNLGNFHYEKKEYSSALSYYRQAYETNKKINNSGGIAMLLQNIGTIHKTNKQLDSALYYFTKSLEIAKDIKSKEIIAANYLSLSELSAITGKYKNAYEYHTLFYSYSDSLLNDKITEQISEMQTKYETEKKELQIKNLEQSEELKNTQLNRQKIINYFVIGSLFLVIATALFIFKNYSEKKKLSHSLAEKNQEITDSINYAKRIQEAILPSTQLLSDYFSDHFVFYKPKDIVSGDFYWIAETNEKIIFTAVDCTGHGVPGAFMSFIGYSLLNQIVKENKITQPAEILKILSKRIKQNLQQQNITSSVKDAMDIALCSYDKKNKTLEYSGAYNPLYYFRNSQFYDIKPDKIAIGNFSEQTKYTHHKMEVQENDILYIFSDGYADQFGGQKQKKFSYKQFREVLFTIHKKPMTEQQKILQDTFVSWKKHNEQTDDVLIVGIKI